MSNPTVREMVIAALESGGYDGLVADDSECACDLSDLVPCGELGEQCTAGWKGPCDCGDHDWHITTVKP